MADSIDPNSPTWRAVAYWANSEIEAARIALETTATPQAETEHQRGRIAQLRRLLQLTQPRPVMPDAGPGYHNI